MALELKQRRCREVNVKPEIGARQLPSRLPHLTACLLAIVVFPLIWVGNLVTTSDAGMAVPDWPGTYGYNLFLYPWRDWFFGPWDLFVEHGHRLLASLAGMISILLVIVTWRTEQRGWVVGFALSLLAMVIFQGVLGGLRVLDDARWIAKVHGCIGPAFFAATVGFCVVTGSRWMQSKFPATPDPASPNQWIRAVALVAVGLLMLAYCQLVLGAFIRHIDDMAPPPVYAILISGHIVVAVSLVLGTIAQFAATRSATWRDSYSRSSINLATLLVLVQVSLGVATWIAKFGWPAWFAGQEPAASFVVMEKSFSQINIVTAHAAIGSLILAVLCVHALRAVRFGWWRAD